MNTFYLGQIKDDNNLLPVYVGRIDGNSIGFYNSTGDLLAKWNPPVPLEAAKEYRDKAPDFLTQIDSLWKALLQSGTKIEERTRQLESIAKLLGLDVKNILSISSFKTSQQVAAKVSKNTISNKNKAKETSSNRNIVTDSVHARSEVSLNKLVDDRYTLGDILGVDDPNATLICVDSRDIRSTDKSNSQFSLLIKYPDGRLEKATMFSQDDGTSPDRDIYSYNRDGSSVGKVATRSMYRINSPLGKNCMISVSYGTYGMVDLQFGKRDITEQDFMAVPLENLKLQNTVTNYVTKEVQDMLDPERGIYQAHNATTEISGHLQNGCVQPTLAEADGNKNTGHQPLDDNHLLIIAANILDETPELKEFYSSKGLADDLKKYLNNHPDRTVEDFTKDIIASCNHYPTHNKY